jgi:hypothetical protein
VLLAADGLANVEIASQVGVSRPTVTGCRARYERSGIGGLSDQARSGRPRTIDHRQLVAATLRPPPKKLGVTHWSSRLLAAPSTHLPSWPISPTWPRRRGSRTATGSRQGWPW